MARGWSNWAGNVRTRVACAHPASVDEVVQLVRAAAAAGERLKVVGSGHSFSAIAAPQTRALQLDRMRAVLGVDAEACTVTAQAGIRLKELVDALAALDLALPLLGTAADQTVGGAIATATHGTGIGFGVLSTLVTDVELVTPAGDVVRCSAAHAPDLFAAARASLGALGVVTQVSLRCRDAYALRAVAEPARFDDALARLDELVGSRRHSKLWWWPHTDEARLWRYDEVEAPGRVHGRPPLLDRERVTAGLGGFALWAGARVPRAIPPLKRALVPFLNRPYTHVDRADRVFNYPVPMRHLELEYALPAEAAAAAMREVRDVVRRDGLVVDFLVELRFTAGDAVWLSPAHGRDSCWVGALMYKSRGWERYFRAVERRLADYDGRPHWGKLHFQDAEYLRRVYPEWERFVSLRARLDGGGVFLNAELERIFGIGAE